MIVNTTPSIKFFDMERLSNFDKKYIAISITVVSFISTLAVHYHLMKIDLLEERIRISEQHIAHADSMSYTNAEKALQSQSKLHDREKVQLNKIIIDLNASNIDLSNKLTTNKYNFLSERLKFYTEQEDFYSEQQKHYEKIADSLSRKSNRYRDLAVEFGELDGKAISKESVATIYTLQREIFIVSTGGNFNGCLTVYIRNEQNLSARTALPCLKNDQSIDDAVENAWEIVCKWKDEADNICKSKEILTPLTNYGPQ